MPLKRKPYRAVEERKMLAFIASELRVHNSHARRKSPRVWCDYVRQYPETTKTPAGLESHFRKMILPRLVNYCKDIASDDFFLLERVFGKNQMMEVPDCRDAEPTNTESSIKSRLRHVVEIQNPPTSNANAVQASNSGDASLLITPHKLRKEALIVCRQLTNLLGAEPVSAADQSAGKIADVFAGSFVKTDKRLFEGAVRGLKWLLT